MGSDDMGTPGVHVVPRGFSMNPTSQARYPHCGAVAAAQRAHEPEAREREQ